MVRGSLSHGKTLISLCGAGLIMTAGCSTKSKQIGPDIQAYREALQRTEGIAGMPAGSETEREALRRFEDLYLVYSEEAIREKVRGVYAEDAWFGDPYHTVQGIDDIEHYFLAMAEPVEHCTFRIDSMHRAGTDYYAGWTMTLVSKAAGKEPITAIGISHMRFDADGKVVFQQDYWDTSVLLDRLPVVGFWTRLVKGKIIKGVEQ